MGTLSSRHIPTFGRELMGLDHRILVLGATGLTGRCIVAQALPEVTRAMRTFLTRAGGQR